MEAMRQSWNDDRLDHLSRRVEEGFQRVDERFEEVDRRFEQVDQRFERVETQLDQMRSEMTSGFAQLNERLDRFLLGLVVVSGGVIAALLAAVLA
jgi:DNA anti-recombination protein RmuC